jgi:hypothetical protein
MLPQCFSRKTDLELITASSGWKLTLDDIMAPKKYLIDGSFYFGELKTGPLRITKFLPFKVSP